MSWSVARAKFYMSYFITTAVVRLKIVCDAKKETNINNKSNNKTQMSKDLEEPKKKLKIEFENWLLDFDKI